MNQLTTPHLPPKGVPMTGTPFCLQAPQLFPLASCLPLLGGVWGELCLLPLLPLFPVPCSLFPVPCSLFPVPCSLFPSFVLQIAIAPPTSS
jgi:hypothetical protein